MTTDKQAPSRPVPPYDPELAAALATWPEPPVSITPEFIPARRAISLSRPIVWNL